MADLGGNIYKYDLHGVRTTFGAVNAAQSLACDNAGNLFVLDAGGIIYKFTPQGAQSTFASGPFSHVAF